MIIEFRKLTDSLIKVDSSIGITSVVILFEVALDEGITMTDISNRTGYSCPTVSRNLARLEDSGLVRREQDSVDNRLRPIFLTKKAKSLLGK